MSRARGWVEVAWGHPVTDETIAHRRVAWGPRRGGRGRKSASRGWGPRRRWGTPRQVRYPAMRPGHLRWSTPRPVPRCAAPWCGDVLALGTDDLTRVAGDLWHSECYEDGEPEWDHY